MSFSQIRTVRKALMIAVGWLAVANLGLIAAGYCRQRSLQNATPLFAAVEHGDREAVSRLLDSGMPVDARRMSNDPEITEYYQRLSIWLRNPDYPFNAGYTPLMIASIRGDEAMAKLLIARGADRRDSAELARRYGHTKLADYLDRARLSIGSVTKRGTGPS